MPLVSLPFVGVTFGSVFVFFGFARRYFFIDEFSGVLNFEGKKVVDGGSRGIVIYVSVDLMDWLHYVIGLVG